MVAGSVDDVDVPAIEVEIPALEATPESGLEGNKGVRLAITLRLPYMRWISAG